MRDPRPLLLLTLLVLATPDRWARAESRSMTLGQVISVAQSRSRAAAQARDRYLSSVWQYRMYRAQFLPTLSLVGMAPDLTRSISRLPLPDGSSAFMRQSFMSSGARLSIGKTIGTTGGDVFVETALERLDLLDGGTGTTFLSTPINVGFRQPLFTFNPYRWQERIEPLRLTEARRDYTEELESVAISAAQSFFDLLSAQDQMSMALENATSTDTLLAAARRRARASRISEDDLLQTELASLNARLDLQRAELDLRARTHGFHSYLGLRESENVRPQISFEVPAVTADVPTALARAHAHRAAAVGLERRRLEAERSVAEARSDPSRSVSLFASFGLSKSANDLGSIYDRGQEHERASIGLQVPILDWGRSHARLRLAESNSEVTMLSVEQARIDLEQEVIRKVLEFNMQRERVRIAATADEVAARRFASTERRFIAGKADAMELNIALSEKDSARRTHVEALRGYWIAYLELRRATHYDFASGQVIEAPLAED